MMKFYPGENTPGKVLDMAQEAEEFFPGGFEHGEIGKCVVCGRSDCDRPHRKYTREGYAKFQIEFMGIERSEAMKRANEEFRVFGGDWAWYPMNREGQFAPPIPDGEANVRAPPPPPEGWPQVKGDRYYDITRAVKAAWKAESAGKSEAELFRLRDDFDQRWANMSGEEEPEFKMPWDYLARAPQNDGGDGSRAQYMGSAGGFHGGHPPQGHGGWYAGNTPAGGTYAGMSGAAPQASSDPAAFAAAYGNLPGMEGFMGGMGCRGGGCQGGHGSPGMSNIHMSGSGGAGFTFYHHQGGQSQRYKFGAPQQQQQQQQQSCQNPGQSQSQDLNQNQNRPPPPKSNAAPQSNNQNKDNWEEQEQPNPADYLFNKDVKFYAETFIKRTKGKPLGKARIWRNILSKKFQDEWGPWARNMNMPWDEIPGIDGDDNDRSKKGYDGDSSPRRDGDIKGKSASDYMREANYDFGEGYRRWKEAGGKMDSSFDEGYERWKKSQGRGGDTAGMIATERMPAANYNFMGEFENWKRAGGKMHRSTEEGYQRWKSQHADKLNKSTSARKSERRDKTRRDYESDSGSDYETDASLGTQHPSAPCGAENFEYEDARRDYEKRWEDQALSKKRDEMHSFHTGMKYAWIMRTGNDGKREVMPWHFKYGKYVRRPFDYGSAAEKKSKKANRERDKTGREPPKPSKPSPSPDDTSKPKTEETGTVYRYEKTKKQFLKDWERVRIAQLKAGVTFKKLAQNHQFMFADAIHDQRARTDTMPWTQYCNAEGEKTVDPFSITSKHAKSRPAKPETPKTVLDTTGGGLFEAHKEDAIREWEELRKTTTSPAGLRKQAQIMQVKLEVTTQNEGAKTELMPWDRFIPAKLSASHPPQPPIKRYTEAKLERQKGLAPYPKADAVVDTLLGKDPADPPAEAKLLRYGKVAGLYISKWNSMCEDDPGISRRVLAKNIQKGFETKAADERTNTEQMSWTEYLDGGAGVAAPALTPAAAPMPQEPVQRASNLGPDEKYAKLKADCITQWNAESGSISSGKAKRKWAQVHQVKFEHLYDGDRSKTEEMPWMRYLRAGPATKSAITEPPKAGPPIQNPPISQMKKLSKETAKKTVPAPPLTPDQAYAKHKAASVEEWKSMSERASGPLVLHKLAKKLQLSLEHSPDNAREQTETTPWPKYLVLPLEDKSETSPDHKTSSSGHQKDEPASPRPELSNMNTNKNYSSKQPTVEPEPSSPRLDSNPDGPIQPVLSPVPSTNNISSESSTLPHAKSPPAAVGMSGIQYEMLKGRFEINWDVQKRKCTGREYPALAKATQDSFEKSAGNSARSRTEVMPWTKYLKTEEAYPRPSSPTASHAPSTASKRPLAQKSQLDKLKAKFESDWLLMHEEHWQGEDAYWSTLARSVQNAFEEETGDERAKTEVMPWSRYLAFEEKVKSHFSSPFVEERAEAVPDQPSAPPMSAYETLKARFATTWELRNEGLGEDEYDKLAMAIQKAFEKVANNKEAKEEIVPWTSYLPVTYGLEQFLQSGKTSIEHKPWSQIIPDAAPMPSTPMPETQPPPGPEPGSDIKYQKVVALFERKWDSLLGKRKGESRVPLAKKMQKNFETAAADDRANSEPMPWTKYLDPNGVVEQTTFGAPEPRGARVTIVDEYRDLLSAYSDILTPAPTQTRPPPLKPTWEQPSQRPRPSVNKQPVPPTKHPVHPPVQLSRYEKDKWYFIADWPKMPDKFPGMPIPELAGKIQRAFKRTSRDERAETEWMPWSEHLEDWYLRSPASEAYDMRLKKEVKRPEPPKLDPGIMGCYKLPRGQETVSKPGYPFDLTVGRPEKPTANAEHNPGTQNDAYETEKRTQRKAWGRLSAAVDMRSMDKEWSKHASVFQRDFARRTKDSRAATEIMPWSGYLLKGHAKPAIASKPADPADLYQTTNKKEEPKTQSHQRRSTLVPVDIYGAAQAPLHNAQAKPANPIEQGDKYQECKANAINAWNHKINNHPDMDQIHLADLAQRFQGVFERQTGRIGYNERGKAGYLPWTYALPVLSVETEAEEHVSASKPTNTHTPANDHPPHKIAGTKPSPSGGEPFIMYEDESEYEREKRYHAWRWSNRIQKVTEGRDHTDWYEHARQFQKSFEKVTQDRRATNEAMPWSNFLGKRKGDFGRGMEPRSEKFKENMRREERRSVRQTHR